MEILGLDAKVAEAMLSVFGEKIFKHTNHEFEDERSLVLNENAILKCHGFDSSVRVELGAKIFILEKEDYWRIVIE